MHMLKEMRADVMILSHLKVKVLRVRVRVTQCCDHPAKLNLRQMRPPQPTVNKTSGSLAPPDDVGHVTGARNTLCSYWASAVVFKSDSGSFPQPRPLPK